MTWNLFVYMAADNDLKDVVKQSLQGLRTKPSDKVNVRVLLDLKKGATFLSFPSPPGPRPEALGRVGTGRASTLARFIAKAQKSTPPGRDALIIWNHGSGRLAIDKGDKGDFLTNEEVKGAIETASKKKTSRRIDLIGCDACLTGTVDLARAVADHADYYVASQTITRRQGWRYREIVEALRRNPKMSAEDLARTIVGLYPAAPDEMMAAWKLSGFRRVLDQVDRLGNELRPVARRRADRAAIIESRGRMVAMEDPDYLDLATCLVRIGGLSPAVKRVAARCRLALEKARVARSARSSLSGMAILIPNQDPRRVPPSERRPAPLPALPPPDNGWNRFVRNFVR